MRKPNSPRTPASISQSFRLVPAALACLAATALAALGQQPARPEFPAGIRLAATARGEAAIAALGQRLPEVAAHYRKTPQQLRALFRSDHSLHADREGRLFYACELGCEHEAEPTAEAEASAEGIGTTDPSPFTTGEAFLLHSRPGANRVIYLDFDGHIDNTPGNWVDGASAPAFDIDSDPATFSASERERIIFIWQRVAEDFAMFDIDVTTEDPGVPALSKSNSSDQTYGIRVVIGGSSGREGDWYTNSAGGVAFVGNFDAANDVPCWVFPGNLGNSEKNIAEAASHEAGHTLGLSHDGTSTDAYYRGQGNWAPIMGVGYNEQIVQWSKGEYADANNPEDDLAIMLTQGAVYRPDDHGGTTATATLLTSDTIPLLAEGVIERRTDLDFFRITAVAGSLNVTVNPPPRDSNLRIELKLYDAAGNLLQTATSADTSAGGTEPVTLTQSVTAGNFFFSVDGIGNGDPLTTGYTDYASLGQYSVSIINLASSWLPTAAGTYQWPTPANWSSGSVPGAAGLAVGINNNLAGAQTINLTSATTVGSLYLGDSDSTHAINIANGGGGSLVFNKLPSAAILGKTTGGDDVISAPISLPGELAVNQSSTGSLTISGAVSGVGPLTKTGSGTLNLSAANNSFTGIIAVNAGTLSLGNLNALGGSTGITLAGGTLATSTDGITISPPITTGATGTTSAVAFSRSSSATGSLTLGNSISGAGNLTFTTPNVNSGNNLQTIFLNSANSYAGSTLITTGNSGNTMTVRSRVANALPTTTVLTLDGGVGAGSGRTTSYDLNGFNQTLAGLTNVEQTSRTQRISNTGGTAATLTIQDNGNRTFSGIIGGTNLSVNKAGSGTFTLAGVNTHTGGTSITGGLLSVADANALGGGAVTVNGGTRLLVAAGLSVANNITIGTNTGQSGRGILESSGTGTATLSGNITINSAAAAGGHLASSAGNDLLLSGVITSSVAVSQRVGTVTYSGGGTGYTTLSSGGTIRVGAPNGIATSATVKLGEFSTNGILDLNGFNQRLTGITQGANTATIGNRSITTDSVLTTTGTSTFAGVIQDVLGSGTRKVGLAVDAGTFTLTGANTYTGQTHINGGTLQLSGGTGTLGTPAGNTTVANSAGLKLTGGNYTLGEALVLSGSGVGTAASTYGALLLNQNSGSFIFNGPLTLSAGAAINTFAAGTTNIQIAQGIGGTGDLTLRASAANNGGALYRLQGASTFTGNTFFSTNATSAGITVQNEIHNALPPTTVLNLQAGANQTAIYRLNGTNQTVAGLQISGTGTLNAIVGGSLTLSTFTVNNSADYTFAGKLGNTGTNENNLALVKSGSNTLILSGTNTYTGATTVIAGTLALGAGNALPDTSPVAIGAATLNAATTGTEIAGTLDVTAATTIKLAAGAKIEFANSNTMDWAGGTLNITGTFVSGASIKFGSSSSGLTPTQLALISVNGSGAGTYSLNSSGYLVSGNNYASWINSFFPGETDPLIIGAGADPDHDGIENGVEMVIGGDPKLGMDTALLPTLELVTDPVGSPAIPAGNYLLFTYRRSDISVAAGVTADCQTDTDLVPPWTPATGVVIQVDDNFTFTPPAAADTDRVRVYVPGGANTQLFGRLNVVVP